MALRSDLVNINKIKLYKTGYMLGEYESDFT